MAKISTYPNVGTPTLSDMLIGTEVTDNNATKNFMISDILGLIGSLGLYVPYTGATANVNLGAFNLDAQDLTLTGDGFFGNNITVTGLTTSNSITYSGNLYAAPGSASVFADVVVLEQELRDGFNLPGTPGQVLSSTGALTQWVSLGSFASNLQDTLDAGNTATQDINLTGTLSITGNSDFFGPVYLDDALLDGAGVAGTAGQVLITNVTNTAWTTYGLEEVLAAGNTATNDINLTGSFYLSDKFYDGTNSPGLFGEYLQSTGTMTQWVSPAFAQFYETNSQNAAPNTPTPMEFNSVDFAFGGVSVVNTNEIQVTQDAYYNIQFSAQIRNTSGAVEVDIWFAFNGTNIPNSNTSVTLSSNTYAVASWNYIARLTIGDAFQIYWMHDNAAGLQASAPTLLHPATPSVIVTVTKIS